MKNCYECKHLGSEWESDGQVDYQVAICLKRHEDHPNPVDIDQFQDPSYLKFSKRCFEEVEEDPAIQHSVGMAQKAAGWLF